VIAFFGGVAASVGSDFSRTYEAGGSNLLMGASSARSALSRQVGSADASRVKRAKTERAEPAVAEVAGFEERLTREEDNELRRLGFFQQVGPLSDHRRERFIELRLRDRRKEVRPPRELPTRRPSTP